MYLAWLIWRRVRIQRLRTVHSTNIIIWLRVLGENFEGKPFSYHWLQQQQQPPVPPHLFNLLLQSIYFIFLLFLDRGFGKCHDLFAARGAHLITPTYKPKNNAPMSVIDILRTQRIAKARIHIERFNDRMKKFKILNGPIHHSKYCILEEIVYVCAFLANFSQLLAE